MTRYDVPPPNYTQVPNIFLDEIMSLPDMTLAELKVTLAIFRQTFGYHKREDELSLTRLEQLTGLSRQSVITGIDAAMQRGTVDRRSSGLGYLYSARLIYGASQESGLVQNLDQGSLNIRPKVVQNLDTQKKERKLKEKREALAPQDAPAPPTEEPREKTKRATRIPCTELPDAWRQFCQRERPDLNPDQVWAKFYDHWLSAPGQRGIKLDWFATWRNWCRTEKATAPVQKSPTPGIRKGILRPENTGLPALRREDLPFLKRS